jgi:hypothetical protein
LGDGIDDPLRAAEKQFDEHPNQVLDLVANLASRLAPIMGVVNVLRNHFSAASLEERTRIFLSTLSDAVRDLEELAGETQARVESPQFLEALIAGVSESARTADVEKIMRFGRILGRSLGVAGIDLQEAAAFTRDLAQLTDADVAALGCLYEVQHDLLAAAVVATGPDPYTQRLARVLESVDAAHVPRDDFYAHCARLTGFGLALEVQPNPARMAPGDHCFRLTKRGWHLVNLMR